MCAYACGVELYQSMKFDKILLLSNTQCTVMQYNQTQPTTSEISYERNNKTASVIIYKNYSDIHNCIALKTMESRKNYRLS